MKYLKLYENFNDEDIHRICRKYKIRDYTINEDGSIDVEGDVSLFRLGLEEIPLKFRNINGKFICSQNNLTSLKNGPIFVRDNFWCDNNLLTSLEFSPETNGNFLCNNNKLTSLEYCPKTINGDFFCNMNKLTSLKFMPKVTDFICNGNDIRDFKGFVEPFEDFSCDDNPIYKIWILFEDKSYIELLNDYDCIRGKNIVINRLNQFLEEIDNSSVIRVRGYNTI